MKAVVFHLQSKKNTQMAKAKQHSDSFDNPNEKLKKIIDIKKTETSALRKILKALDKNVKHKNKKND